MHPLDYALTALTLVSWGVLLLLRRRRLDLVAPVELILFALGDRAWWQLHQARPGIALVALGTCALSLAALATATLVRHRRRTTAARGDRTGTPATGLREDTGFAAPGPPRSGQDPGRVGTRRDVDPAPG